MSAHRLKQIIENQFDKAGGFPIPSGLIDSQLKKPQNFRKSVPTVCPGYLMEGVAEAEHEVVLLLEVEELVADVEEEGVGQTDLQIR